VGVAILMQVIQLQASNSEKETNMLQKKYLLLPNRFLMSLVGFMFFAFWVSVLLPVNAQAAAPELFKDASATQSAIMSKQTPNALRSRYVNVNTSLLFDSNRNARDAKSLPEVTLTLFKNATYIGEVKGVISDRWGTTWYGKLKNHAKGYFYLTVVEDAFIAHVASLLGVYEVSFAGKGLYRVVEIDQSKFKDHPEDYQYELPGDILPMDSLGEDADSGSRIDIMSVYTATTRAAEGSTAAMKARIKLAVDETNTSYANSGITPRLRLVHVEEVVYTETGNLSTDLNRLLNSSDGFMDNVHTLRNTYGADMVGLIVENGGAYCGLASSIMATASNAFQVTARGCATGYYSFGHEFGHLQGARHDMYVDSTLTPYSYGHGYVHPKTSDPNERWRTVMAYNNRCADWGYSCTRLKYWSNPSKSYGGDTMGDSYSQNYKVLNTTAYTVANFRTEVISSDFNSTFNTSSSGWSAATGTWSLYSSAYYRSTGLANLGAHAKRTGKYGDLTYEVRMNRTGVDTGYSNRIIVRGNTASLNATKMWSPSYNFQYSNDGSFSVFEVDNTGTATALKAWTTSSAIVKNGWNTLKVVAVGSSLKFYINGTLVWSGSDSTLKTGQVGFGFFRDTDAGTMLVDWAKLSTTPTADANPYEEVAEGVELIGGTIDQSP
jgi:hypothetical protein